MNASASAVLREEEVQSKIRKVRQFGRIARFVCAAFFGFGLVGGVVFLLVFVFTHVPTPSIGNGDSYELLVGLLTLTQLKVCLSLGIAVLVGVWLAGVYQLYRLFGNLAVGVIYTSENVRRVRHVGLLFLLLTVLVGIVIPAALVAAHSLIDPSIPFDHDRILPAPHKLVADFVAPGLILLVSWIMDVGLYEKDHADALRREADLVI